MSSRIHILEPAGVLDGTQVPTFSESFESALQQDIDAILIDLSNISFVDSSGLGALVISLKKARASQKQMYICSINEQVQMLFELTSMDRVFQVLPDRAALLSEAL